MSNPVPQKIPQELLDSKSKHYFVKQRDALRLLWERLRSDVSFVSTVPSSASDKGTKGMIAMDENYIYRCTATDTWKRTALSTW